MKKIAFKTMSVLLTAGLLVAALPIAAFAEDVSPCVVAPCNHIYQAHYEYTEEPYSDTHHLTTKYKVQTCMLCGRSEILETVGSYYTECSFDWELYDRVGILRCLYCKNIVD